MKNCLIQKRDRNTAYQIVQVIVIEEKRENIIAVEEIINRDKKKKETIFLGQKIAPAK